MASKFISVAVLVILGHNSFMSSSDGVHGLSEEVKAGLYELRAKRELATQTSFEAQHPIIDILSGLAFEHIDGSDCESTPAESADISLLLPLDSAIRLDIDVKKSNQPKPKLRLKDVTDLLLLIARTIQNYDIVEAVKVLPKLGSIPAIDNHTTALLAEGSRLHKIAFDYIVDAIPFALGASCDDLDKTKIEMHAYIDVIWLGIALAIDLTVVDDHPGNEAAIDFIQSTSPIVVGGLIKRIYKLFRTCSHTTDANLLTLIDAEEEKSVDDLQLVAVSILNGCRWLIVAVATGNKSPVLLTYIEESGDKMNTALREAITHAFVTSEVFYIKSHLDNTAQVAASDLAANQYATIVTVQYGKEAAESLYDEMFYQITRRTSGIENDGEAVFSRNDAARAKLSADLGYGIDVFVKLMLRLHPENSSNVTEACKIFQINLMATSDIYIKMIKFALDQTKTYSDVSAAISDHKNKAIALYRKDVNISISLIRNNRNFNDEIEAEFAKLHDAAISGSENSIGCYVNAIEIFAKLVRKNEIVSTDYNSAIEGIRAAQQQSVSGFRNKTEALSQAFLLFLTISE